MSRIPIWIDTDTGVDDAIALMAAVVLERQGKLKLAGVSAVCGNVELHKTFENARNVLYYAGREDISVYPGAEKPLRTELETAADVHGANGLGGAQIPESPAPRESEPAWDALYRCAKEYNGELELILIGPETNAAIAFRKYPDLKNYLKRILVMGGAAVGGNRTPEAEFNIWADPDAAQEVFQSGVPVVMCGLDVTMKAELTRDEVNEVEKAQERGCRLFRESTQIVQKLYMELIGKPSFFVHDVCPVLYTVYPELFTAEEAKVFVETEENERKGKTVVEQGEIRVEEKNAAVVLGVARERFAELLINILKSV